MKNDFKLARLGRFGLPLILGLTSPLYAQEAAPKGQDWSPIFGVVLMFAVFFLLIIWPQMRRTKKHQEFLGSLKRGDAIVTTAGVYGKIHGIADRMITLEIAPNVRIRIDRQAVQGLDTTQGASTGDTQGAVNS